MKTKQKFSSKKASAPKPVTFEEIKEVLAEQDDDILLADGYEDALIGYVEIFTKTLALYDRAKCIEILMKRDKMTYESANEFFEFNTTGAYVGEKTPAFATFLRKAQK